MWLCFLPLCGGWVSDFATGPGHSGPLQGLGHTRTFLTGLTHGRLINSVKHLLCASCLLGTRQDVGDIAVNTVESLPAGLGKADRSPELPVFLRGCNYLQFWSSLDLTGN